MAREGSSGPPSAEQIDIDVDHPEGHRYLDGILRIFAENGVRLVRLDAGAMPSSAPGRTAS
jgi:sucrose phosphorylase